MKDLVKRLRAPCGKRVRPGWICSEDLRCQDCDLKDEAADAIEQYEEIIGLLEEELSQYESRR